MRADDDIQENMEVLHATIESLKTELAVKVLHNLLLPFLAISLPYFCLAEILLLRQDEQLRDAADNIEKLKVEVKFGGNSLSDVDLKQQIENLKKELADKSQKLKDAEEAANRYMEEKQQLDKRVLRVTEKVQEWNEQVRQTLTLSTLSRSYGDPLDRYFIISFINQYCSDI